MFIFLSKKLNSSFYLFINDKNINKLIIKNKFFILLIKKFFHCFNHAKYFILFNLKKI